MVFPSLRKSTREDGWREAVEDMRNFIGSHYVNSSLSGTFYMSHVVLEVHSLLQPLISLNEHQPH